MNETDNLDSWWNNAEQCEDMRLLEEQAKEDVVAGVKRHIEWDRRINKIIWSKTWI